MIRRCGACGTGCRSRTLFRVQCTQMFYTPVYSSSTGMHKHTCLLEFHAHRHLPPSGLPVCAWVYRSFKSSCSFCQNVALPFDCILPSTMNLSLNLLAVIACALLAPTFILAGAGGE